MTCAASRAGIGFDGSVGVLHGKLALITRTAEAALELLQNRRALRVEWAIVGLIVFEIVLTLVQWAVGAGGH